MAGSVLLIHDDIAAIASIRRLLSRRGLEVVLATSSSDAVTALSHGKPDLIVLAPAVEDHRGGSVIDELRRRPELLPCRVILLGGPLEGEALPVVPLPLDGAQFQQMVADVLEVAPNLGEPSLESASASADELPELPVEAVAAEESWPWEEGAAEEIHVEPEASAARPVTRKFEVASSDEPSAPDATAALEASETPQAAEPEHDGLGSEGRPSWFEQGDYSQPEPAPKPQETHAEEDVITQLNPFRAPVPGEWSRATPRSTLLEPRHPVAVPQRDEDEDWSGFGDAPAQDAGGHETTARFDGTAREVDEVPPPAEQEDALDAPATSDRWSESSVLAPEEPHPPQLDASPEQPPSEEHFVQSEVEGPPATEASAGEAWFEPELEAEPVEASPENAAEANHWFEEAEQPPAPQVAEPAESPAAETPSSAAEANDWFEEAEQAPASVSEAVESPAAVTGELAVEQQQLEGEVGAMRAGDHRAEGESAVESWPWDASAPKDSMSDAVAASEDAVGHLPAVEAAAPAPVSEPEPVPAREAQREPEPPRPDVSQLEMKAPPRERARHLFEAEASTTKRDLDAEREDVVAVAKPQRVAEASDVSSQVEAQPVELAPMEAEAEAAEPAGDVEEIVVDRAEAESESGRTSATFVEVPLSSGAMVRFPQRGRLNRDRFWNLLVRVASSPGMLEIRGATGDTVRTLWISAGRLVAATSTHPGESLLDQARRDGLIDARQERDLRSLREVPSIVLRALRDRRYLRELEVLPLVQRNLEHVAVELFSQPEVDYVARVGAPPAHVVALAASRPLLAVVADAVRRHLNVETSLELLGGMDSIPLLSHFLVEPEELGFSPRQLELLRTIDGFSSVEELLQLGVLAQDEAVKALAAAVILQMVEIQRVTPAARIERLELADLDIRRLAAKFEEVQDADYFAILGVPRSAGSAEVERAFDRLSTEFHPLKFVAHPDPSLQRRAQQIQEVLSEAARALRSDQLRGEYARSLRD